MVLRLPFLEDSSWLLMNNFGKLVKADLPLNVFKLGFKTIGKITHHSSRLVGLSRIVSSQ